jgi:hypothetical protein
MRATKNSDPSTLEGANCSMELLLPATDVLEIPIRLPSRKSSCRRQPWAELLQLILLPLTSVGPMPLLFMQIHATDDDRRRPTTEVTAPFGAACRLQGCYFFALLL